VYIYIWYPPLVEQVVVKQLTLTLEHGVHWGVVVSGEWDSRYIYMCQVYKSETKVGHQQRV
jgi:hypothetical protein